MADVKCEMLAVSKDTNVYDDLLVRLRCALLHVQLRWMIDILNVIVYFHSKDVSTSKSAYQKMNSKHVVLMVQ